jgi:hypothetical protein
MAFKLGKTGREFASDLAHSDDSRRPTVMPGLDPGIHGNPKGGAVERGWPGRARP